MNELEELSDKWAGKTIGLLGGSFNPAHAGHLHIAKEAFKRLDLDAVWLMVSPQNPLKSTDDMASFEDRFASAEKLTKDFDKIIPVDIERYFDSCYTAETLAVLQNKCPEIKFIWLMGADNLEQIHKWEQWQDIFKSVPIAVLDRPPENRNINTYPAVIEFADSFIAEKDAKELKSKTAPCWTFLRIPLHPLSATEIREQEKS